MITKETLVKGFLAFQQGCGLSSKTVRRSGYMVTRFLGWLGEMDIREADENTLFDYREHLSTMISRFRGTRLSPESIKLEMSTLKSFFEYLFMHEFILKNPLEGVRLTKAYEKRMRSIFTEADIVLLLDSITVRTPAGQRDRALFELMYSSGPRINEALHIETTHINLEERTLLIRKGKGKKDRYVPFSKTALTFLLIYIGEGRRKQLKRMRRTEEKKYVFLGGKGRVRYDVMKTRFKDYLKSCCLEGKGYTMHSIRHACATHLLLHGASIRYVQELLGHEHLKTTQTYTRPHEENIKKVYRTYHPRENEYFKEVDEEYVKHVDELKARIEWSMRANEQQNRLGHKKGFGRWKGT